MGLSDFKITDADITSKGVQASPDQLSGTAEDNKKVFDRLTSGPVRDGHNKLIDALVALGVEQLIQNVTAAGRQAGPDMLPGVLGRDEAADVDEPQQRRLDGILRGPFVVQHLICTLIHQAMILHKQAGHIRAVVLILDGKDANRQHMVPPFAQSIRCSKAQHSTL